MIIIGLAAGAVVGLALFSLLSAIAPDLTVALLTVYPGVVGTVLWRLSGSTILAALSWTVPLTLALAVANYALPEPFDKVAQTLCLGFYLAMLLSSDVATWWHRRILRQA
jgi:hypothetical protein